MKKRLFYFLPIVLLGLFGVIAWYGLAPNRDPSALPSALIGKPAPRFTLTTLDPASGGLTSQDFAGKVTVVNFFASWCVPCKAEHPLLFLLNKDYHVPVYGIAFQDQTADTARYIQEMGSPYSKIGLDQNGRTAIDFGVTGVPETFILDKDGVIRYRLAQPIDPDRLAAEIGPLLKSLTQ
jgi:cytochrome c biogenesis protein CcmG/thiol:disulfide interchange protein DsbE